jgi:hypothetical protein
LNRIFDAGWPLLKQVFENSEGMMTRRSSAAPGPKAPCRPLHKTLWRWLERLVKARQLNRDGEATQPFAIGCRAWRPVGRKTSCAEF